MADVTVSESSEDCATVKCRVVCGSEPSPVETLPNGDVNECRAENGLEDVHAEFKDNLAVDGHISTGSGETASSKQSENRSQRNSSTSDSGIYSSDADHTLNRGEDDSISSSMDKCEIRDETDEKPVVNDEENGIHYVVYESERQMPEIMRLITKDLSEPYSIYTYRYFIHNWPKLCFLAMCGSKTVGAIVCKLDLHKKMVRRGYIAMLAVDENYRRRGIGSHLVLKAIRAMVADDCDEVVLETEITNKSALQLYENLGFVRDKRLFRYYLNGVDALRLKLWLR